MEIKSGSFTGTSGVSPFVQSQLAGSIGFGSTVSPSLAYLLHAKVDSVGNAVDKIASAFAQMTPALRDKRTGDFLEYEDDHPILKLLSNTRSGQSSQEFLFDLMTSYCVAGSAYPVAIGNVKLEPVGLYSIPANMASPQEGGDGWLGSIHMSANYDQSTYKRQIIPKRPWTYLRSDNMAETIQVKQSSRRHSVEGQSPIERIYFQAVTKFYGHQSNASILKNGSRPGGFWSPKDASLNQDNYEAFRSEVAKMTGPGAAGANIVAPQPVNYQNLMLSPRDMDFINLIDSTRAEIYTQYDIPLPLVLKETMTLGNYSQAITAFYDLSVLPRAKFVLNVMGKWLLSRYKDGDRYELTVNEKQLDAIKTRLIERQKAMKEAGIYSLNEMRGAGGYEDIGPEGDDIYQPANLIPIGTDKDTRL